jgi:hypothetical protein
MEEPDEELRKIRAGENPEGRERAWREGRKLASQQSAETVELRPERNANGTPTGKWQEIDQKGNAKPATSTYSFVVNNGRIYGSRFSHRAAAGPAGVSRGGEITFNRVADAGEAMFQKDGTLDSWNGGSGTFRPAHDRPAATPQPTTEAPGLRRAAIQAGLPAEKFTKPAGDRKLPQLPVMQPKAGAPARPAQPTRTRSSRVTGGDRTSQAVRLGSAQTLRSEAIQAGITLAHSIIKEGLQQISEAKAHAAAWNEFYGESERLVGELWDRPGEGVKIRFQFMHVQHPQPTMPNYTEYLGMAYAIGPDQGITVKPPQGDYSRLRDVPAHLQRSESIARWIPNPWPERAAKQGGDSHGRAPQQTPGMAPAAGSAKSTEDSPPPVTTGAGLDQALQPHLTREGYVGTKLNEYEALTRGTDTFSGYQVTASGAHVTVTHSLRETRLGELRVWLRERLGSRAESLQADIERDQRRLDGYLSEHWPSTIGRGDITLNSQLYNSARAHQAAARNMIEMGAFRDAWESIQKGERQVYDNWKLLYHYANGHPYEGPD